MPPSPSPVLLSPGGLWRWRWHGLAILGAVVLLAWCAHAVGLRALMEQAVGRLRAAGAPLFFSGMAVLPAFGFPLMPFALAAGPAFAPALGRGGVIACSILAVALNVALSYALASTWLRPLVEKLMVRLGYRLPAPRRDRAWFFITLVRLAPGLPFWAQSYLLGLMRVRFGAYLLVSTLVPACYLTGTIILGDALMQGNKRAAFAALAALALVGTAVFFLRRRMEAKAPAVIPAAP
ncbi:MAG: hypothetical protein NTV51_17360 [Verrucomicrobia bacterium]|nr:hypothetical protein [Verrucomicrobiota bacterium]